MKNPSVVIIKKPKRGDHGGHHGGAWKVAYADFVTAMMAFFLVMWLVAQSQGVRQAVAGYFKDPGIFDYQKSNGPIAGGQMQLDPQSVPRLRQNMEDGQVVMIHDQETLAKTAGRLKDLLNKTPEFKRLQKSVDIQLTPEGLRIELLESSESTFFDSGSAALRKDTEQLLMTIAEELGNLQNPIILEGHTDARPYSNTNGSYSNWELSVDRANAARRVMMRAGLRDDQVGAVRGYAAMHLRTPADPLDPHNRRVSILVQALSKPEALGKLAKTSGAELAPAAPGAPEREEKAQAEKAPPRAQPHDAAPAKPH